MGKNSSKKRIKSLEEYLELFEEKRNIEELFMPYELKEPIVHVYDIMMERILQYRENMLLGKEDTYLSIKDLISKKDYDYIHLRYQNEHNSFTSFATICNSKDGKLQFIFPNKFSEKEEVLKFYEWSNDKVLNGITIVLQPLIYVGYY